MKLSDGISRLNEWIAKVASWFALALTLVVTFEVCMRYFFRAPTIWSFEISWMLYAAQFMLGWAFTHHIGGHVKVGVIYERFSPSNQRRLDIFFNVLFLFPLCVLLVIYGAKYAGTSWMIKEGSHFTIWSPPIYPIKTLIPFVFLMLGLQALVDMLDKKKRGDK